MISKVWGWTKGVNIQLANNFKKEPVNGVMKNVGMFMKVKEVKWVGFSVSSDGSIPPDNIQMIMKTSLQTGNDGRNNSTNETTINNKNYMKKKNVNANVMS